MYFYLEIHQVSTKYRSRYDISPISFYCTQHDHSNYKFYSNFTKLDLAKSVKAKVQNTVKTFHEFKLQNQQTPVVKSGLAYLTISVNFSKSHSCHLRSLKGNNYVQMHD